MNEDETTHDLETHQKSLVVKSGTHPRHFRLNAIKSGLLRPGLQGAAEQRARLDTVGKKTTAGEKMEFSFWLVGCLLADSSDRAHHPQALATRADSHLSSVKPPTGTAESPS